MSRINVLMIGPQPPAVGGISSYIRDLKQILEIKYNLRVYSIIPYIINEPSPHKILIKSYFMIKNLLKIVRLHKKVDIAHVHTSSYISFFENSLYIVLIKLLNRKVVLHIHAPDFDIFLNKNKYLKTVILRILSIPDFIIVLSAYWRDLIKCSLDNHSKIVILPNAANAEIHYIDMIYSREMLHLPRDRKIIFSVGNLEERKGFHYLIQAMDVLKKQNIDALCIIGGAGEIKEALLAEISNLNLNDYINLIGFIPDEELNFWFNSSDVVVVPSLAEGVPIVIFEALRCGKPCIGTNVGGIPDILISDDLGFLVEPRNASDLAKKLDMSLYHKWDTMKIIEYSDRFNFDNIGQNILKLYKNALG